MSVIKLHVENNIGHTFPILARLPILYPQSQQLCQPLLSMTSDTPYITQYEACSHLNNAFPLQSSQDSIPALLLLQHLCHANGTIERYYEYGMLHSSHLDKAVTDGIRDLMRGRMFEGVIAHVEVQVFQPVALAFHSSLPAPRHRIIRRALTHGAIA